MANATLASACVKAESLNHVPENGATTKRTIRHPTSPVTVVITRPAFDNPADRGCAIVVLVGQPPVDFIGQGAPDTKVEEAKIPDNPRSASVLRISGPERLEQKRMVMAAASSGTPLPIRL
jgi:hypothetical protein